MDCVEIGALSYHDPVLHDSSSYAEQGYMRIEFSLSDCYNISTGQVIKFNGIDYKVASLVFSKEGGIEKVKVSGISIQLISELIIAGLDRPILHTSNADASCKEPVSEFDKDVDNILKGIFEKDYQKEIKDLQILKQTNRRV